MVECPAAPANSSTHPSIDEPPTSKCCTTGPKREPSSRVSHLEQVVRRRSTSLPAPVRPCIDSLKRFLLRLFCCHEVEDSTTRGNKDKKSKKCYRSSCWPLIVMGSPESEHGAERDQFGTDGASRLRNKFRILLENHSGIPFMHDGDYFPSGATVADVGRNIGQKNVEKTQVILSSNYCPRSGVVWLVDQEAFETYCVVTFYGSKKVRVWLGEYAKNSDGTLINTSSTADGGASVPPDSSASTNPGAAPRSDQEQLPWELKDELGTGAKSVPVLEAGGPADVASGAVKLWTVNRQAWYALSEDGRTLYITILPSLRPYKIAQQIDYDLQEENGAGASTSNKVPAPDHAGRSASSLALIPHGQSNARDGLNFGPGFADSALSSAIPKPPVKPKQKTQTAKISRKPMGSADPSTGDEQQFSYWRQQLDDVSHYAQGAPTELALLEMDGVLYFAEKSDSQKPLCSEQGDLVPLHALAAAPGQELIVVLMVDITEVDQEAEETAKEIWAKTRPKDAWTGLKQGVGSIVGGAATGVVALGAATVGGVRGAKPGLGNKALGLVKGLGVGLVAGVAMPVAGVVGGATQIVRGVKAEATGFTAKRQNKIWDPETGTWVNVNLQLMDQNVQTENRLLKDQKDGTSPGNKSNNRKSGTAGSGGSGNAPVEVVDTEYYDLLGIDPYKKVDSAEIKKAYYKMARTCHPDKNPDDENAKAKFQQLSDAYSVLSDDHLREKYNKQGKDAVLESENIPKIEPTVFFALLFGSEKFDGYVGDMSIATLADSMLKGFEQKEGKDSKRTQQRKKNLKMLVDTVHVPPTTGSKTTAGQRVEFSEDLPTTGGEQQPPAPTGTTTSASQEEINGGLKSCKTREQTPNPRKSRSGMFSGFGGNTTTASTSNGGATSSASATSSATTSSTYAGTSATGSSASAEKMDEDLDEDGEKLEDPFSSMGDVKFKRQQWRRQVQCAVFLRERVAKYVEQRDEPGFRASVEQEARNELSKASFGRELLGVLGDLYVLRATVFLADEVKGRFTLDALSASHRSWQKKWSNRATLIGSGYTALKQARKVEKTMKKVEKAEKDETKTDQEKHEMKAMAHTKIEDETLPAFLQLAWAICVRDLEETVKNVVKFLLKDVSVPWVLRIRRAQALLILGDIFLQVANEEDQPEVDHHKYPVPEGEQYVGPDFYANTTDGAQQSQYYASATSGMSFGAGAGEQQESTATAGTSSGNHAPAPGSPPGGASSKKGKKAGSRSPGGRDNKTSARELIETAMIGTITKER
ncbi:unnamed protein product [Amoebophrya sp. A120]|nr:unnamed protein product [Amoebophrya sp. A120]|eukprot:GSA120T00002238001.1